MVMIPMPASFMPNSVPKAATAQSRYGPLMQTLMAKQAAMQKGTMPMPAGPKVAAPKVAAPQFAVQKPAMPMPPAPTDAGPMPSEAGIPLWRQLAPGPERDAAYARYMNAQSTPTAPQPVAPANAGMPAWTQYMGDLTGPQPVASGPAPNSLPLGSGFNITLPKVAPNMFSSTPTAPMSPAPTDAGPMPSDWGIPAWRRLGLSGPEQDPAYMQYLNTQSGPQPTPGFAGFGRVLQDMGAQGNMPELPAMQQPAITLPAMPVMPKPAMPQPVMPKPAMPQSAAPQLVAAPQPQFGPRMQALMAKQRAAAQPMPAPQGMAMGGLMDKYYGGGMC